MSMSSQASSGGSLRRVVASYDPRFTEEYRRGPRYLAESVQRRVHWSDSVPVDEGAEETPETEVPEEVECCKPEWLERGWQCLVCGRGVVPRAVSVNPSPGRALPTLTFDFDGSSSEEAYVVSCRPSCRPRLIVGAIM